MISKAGFEILMAHTGHLQKGRPDKGGASDFDHVFFKLEIPNATAVVIVVGDDWNQLEKKEGSLWQGEVGFEAI